MHVLSRIGMPLLAAFAIGAVSAAAPLSAAEGTAARQDATAVQTAAPPAQPAPAVAQQNQSNVVPTATTVQRTAPRRALAARAVANRRVIRVVSARYCEWPGCHGMPVITGIRF